MTHEEIENITKRLQAIQLPYGPYEILRAFNVAVSTEKCFKDILIELLKQADLNIPIDADGEPICIQELEIEV